MYHDITLVVTSCGRHDLLKKTLDSFVKLNTYPIKETIIIEDGDLDAPYWLLPDDSTPHAALGEIKYIKNGRRRGQIFSIDRAYSEVKTPYIFHCEDDWEFTRSGFMQESLSILENYPEILQVWMRDDSDHPNQVLPKYPFKIKETNWANGWSGFAFNPGLRRLSDYKRIGSYGQQVGYNPQYVGELELSRLYFDLGFVAANIPAACKHIGWERHVEWSEAPKPPKVLIAIPVCWKYSYKDQAATYTHVNGENQSRVQAVRDTWLNYAKPFASYVDVKFFYGTGTDSQLDGLRHDEEMLDVADDYKSLPAKVKAIYKYALDNGYDYVFKGDDDTFIYIDRLMASDFEEHDYLGYVGDRPNMQEQDKYCSGGSGYWLSRDAMKLVTSAEIPTGVWAEDWWVGSVLRSHGVKAVRDARYLPGFWEHFVDLKVLPEDHSYISLHACTPKMMQELYSKTLSPNFAPVLVALHEKDNNPRLPQTIELQNSLYEECLIGDIVSADVNKDLKNKLNKALEKLIKVVMKQAERIDILEHRLESYNLKASHKI